MTSIVVLYLCDGKECFDGPCLNEDCEHTRDIRHALHKDDLEDRVFKHVMSNGVSYFVEVKEEE